MSESERTRIFEQQPTIVRIVRSFWRIDPFIVFGIFFLLGLLPLIFAVFVSPIGAVSYYMPVSPDPLDPSVKVACTEAFVRDGICIKKQVGYAYAINWWSVLVIFMPVSLYFAFTSVQSMQRVFARMLEQRMFCNRDWSFSMEDRPGSTLAGLKALVRTLWLAFSVAGFCILLVVTATVVIDWYCVVHAPLVFGDLLTNIAPDERPALCRNVAGQEVDWSIAAIFGEPSSIQLPKGEVPPDWLSNYVFSAYVYGLLLVELNLVLIYFCFIFALALSVHRLRRGQFGIRILPNLKSGDTLKRMGFENFEPVLQPCIFITILSFIIAFTMRIQNEYLRSSDPGNIFGFMVGDISNSVSSDGSLKDIGQMFDIGRLADPNSQAGGPALIIIFALVSITIAFILRHAARDAASAVEQALQQDGVREKVVKLYGDIKRKDLEKRLKDIVVWPLSWPRLRQLLFLAAAGIACFFFYKLAFIWIAIVLVRVVLTEFSGKA
jgi:hypothetical protein